MDIVSRLWPSSPDYSTVATFTVITTVAVLTFLQRYLYPRHPKVIPGPLTTLIPKLSDDEIARLDYSPNYFPGPRDVETPYGSMRVYEWGPLTGRKILFIHGISTSCQTLTKLAHALAIRGHRVMLFDLFGRGFSDGVGDIPHDARLYVSQALCALASSPVPWLTGDGGGFDLAGYSLGGGVAVHFAAAFPAAVRSLVLLAPAGMIRPESFGALSRWVFTAGLVPERLLAVLTRRRLQQPIASSAVRARRLLRAAGEEAAAADGGEKAAGRSGGDDGADGTGTGNGNADASAGAAVSNGDAKGHHHQPHLPHLNGSPGAASAKADHGAYDPYPVEFAIAEVDGCVSHHPNEAADRLEMRVMRYVRWMLTNHHGFVPAFMGCIREGPLMGQQDSWRKVGERRAAGTTCVVLGQQDEIIDPAAYEEDALPLLGGRAKVHWTVVEGGSHDFVMTHAEETLGIIEGFWAGMEAA